MQPVIEFSNRFSKDRPVDVRFICIVGSSGAGKSEAVRILKEQYGNILEFPVRYTTRPPRPDDDPAENVAITEKEFERLKAGGQIAFSWKKTLNGVGEFWYGTPRPSSEDKICVVSGNNAFAREVRLPEAIVMELWADQATRKTRLLNRSAHLSEKEMTARLEAHDALSLDDVDMRVRNVGTKAELEKALSEIMKIAKTEK